MESGSGEANATEQTGDGLRATLVPNFIRRRYGLKLLLLLFVVFLVIASVGVFSYVQTSETVEAQTESTLQATASNHADAISDWRANRISSTKGVADDAVLRDSTAATEDVLEHVKGEKSQANTGGRSVVANIHVIDLQEGSLVTSTSTRLRSEGIDGATGAWTDLSAEDFRSADSVWETETAYRPTADSQAMIAYASPVPGNEDLAVVLVGEFGDFVSDLRSAGDQSTFVLSDSKNPVVGDEVDVEDDGFSSAVAGQPSFGQVGDSVQAYASVTGSNWVVVTAQPEATAFQVRDDVGFNVAALVAAALITLAFVGVVIVRQTIGPLRRLRDKAKAMEDGDLSVSLAHGRIDEFGRLYNGFDSMRNSLRNQISEAQQARQAAEDARVDAEAMTMHLEQKADEYANVMQACAEGDLTARMNASSESEAMTDIAEEFNEMILEIESTTAEVKAFASEVATASEQVTASSEEVRSASEQVTESIQEISDGAESQNESLQAVSQEMEQLSTTTEEIAASSNEVADLAERTAETGRSGREAAQAAIEGMREIQADSTDAVDAITALEAEMTEIDELIEFIGDIAKETNMLALNANIEASRGSSGGDDSGEGFAVVAQEVKDLATEAKDAAEDIEDRLERIQEKTETTAAEVQRTSDRVEEHAGSVENAVTALEDIAEYAQETNTGVQEISAATEEQAASTQEVVAMVDDAATISEETTAESENVAAAAEEQTTALTEVSQSASRLATNASTLSDALDRFQTDVAPSDVEGDVVTEDPVVAFEKDDSFQPDADAVPEGDGEPTADDDELAGDDDDQTGGDDELAGDDDDQTAATGDGDSAPKGDGDETIETDASEDAPADAGPDGDTDEDMFEFGNPDN